MTSSTRRIVEFLFPDLGWPEADALVRDLEPLVEEDIQAEIAYYEKEIDDLHAEVVDLQGQFYEEAGRHPS